MSVIPASSLSSSDLHVLGNNLVAAVRQDRHHVLSAVNRSLAVHSESVSRLFSVRPRAGARKEAHPRRAKKEATLDA